VNTDEERLRRIFHDAVPALPEPADRAAAVAGRVRRGRIVTTGLATVALAGVVAGVLLAQPTDTSRHLGAAVLRTPGCAASAPADQPGLDRTATRLRPEAESRYADSFADLEITDRLRVYRKPSAGFDAWVMQDFAADCVELVDAPYSGRELQAFRDQVDADRDYFEKQGIDLNSVTVDVDGTITIGVDADQVGKAKDRIPGRYATHVVIVEEGPVPPAILRPS
jgi:hypothetical protein